MTEHHAMGKHQEHDVVEILRDRLGMHYRSSMDSGRDEIVRVIAAELNVGRDEAEQIMRQQLDAGRIRYITRAEQDVDDDVAAQDDGRTDRANRMDTNDITDRSRNLAVNAIPGGGGPSAATSGLTAGAAAPIAAGGTTMSGAVPLAAGAPIGESADDLQGGYWDFAGDKAGVKPSSTRKGQVEPKGT